MNVHDLIYVQLQLSLLRNEPVSQYSESELFIPKKMRTHMRRMDTLPRKVGRVRATVRVKIKPISSTWDYTVTT